MIFNPSTRKTEGGPNRGLSNTTVVKNQLLNGTNVKIAFLTLEESVLDDQSSGTKVKKRHLLHCSLASRRRSRLFCSSPRSRQPGNGISRHESGAVTQRWSLIHAVKGSPVALSVWWNLISNKAALAVLFAEHWTSPKARDSLIRAEQELFGCAFFTCLFLYSWLNDLRLSLTCDKKNPEKEQL